MSQNKAQLLNPINGNINVSGVVTAAQFVGGGSGLTGVATTDNIQTATEAVFLSGVKISGVTTASGGVVGNLTGNVTGNVTGNADTATTATTATNASGLTGTPNITVGSVNASSGTFTGNVSIAGTLTYEDVTNVDSVGVVTARTDINLGDSIIHIGDTNTKIRFPAADTFTVETSGTEALRVTSGGEVVVNGTATGSSAKFEVRSTTGSVSSATARLNGDATDTGAINTGSSLLFAGHDGGNSRDFASIFAGKENASSGNYDAYLAFGTRSNGSSLTERLRIDSSGKVGININNPGSYNSAGNELVLGNTGNNGGMTIVSGTGNNGHIFFADGTGTPNQGIIKYEHATDQMAFNIATAEKLRITSAGITVTGTVTDSNGDLRITPILAKSGDYTLVATDTGKTITRTGGNITVPQSMTAGMVVTIINNHNSTMSIIKGTGVTLRSTDGSDATKTLAAYGVATVLYIAASEAYLTGTGLS